MHSQTHMAHEKLAARSLCSLLHQQKHTLVYLTNHGPHWYCVSCTRNAHDSAAQIFSITMNLPNLMHQSTVATPLM
jgi:hypothetical protein